MLHEGEKAKAKEMFAKCSKLAKKAMRPQDRRDGTIYGGYPKKIDQNRITLKKKKAYKTV